MSQKLARKFPNDRSYVGYATDGSSRKIRFSLNAKGLNAVITGPGHGVQFIEPLTKDKQVYRVYDRAELGPSDPFTCLVEEMEEAQKVGYQEKLIDDLQLRTYRLALAATGEYSQFHIELEGVSSGTEEQQKAVVLSAMTTAITRVNAILENDLAIALELIDNNEEIIYLNGATDPYTNDDGSTMLNENQANLDLVIGNANYDMGHVFSTGGGGVAELGGACVPGSKARAVTGLPNPIGERFYFDFVIHEIGHHLGANHTFNSDNEVCGRNGQRNEETAVEPGSGSTIMSYAGLCAPDNIQSQVDPYFHAVSIREIIGNLSQLGRDCAATTDLLVNQNVPVANAGPDILIPVGTPFVLKGSGSDADNDPISFCWEQVDNGITVVPPAGTSTSGALYRSLPPVEDPDRYFPELRTLASGSLSSTWEVTPLVARQLNFTLTVRDNNPEAGQLDIDDLLVTVTDAAGPFAVTSQATDGLAWAPGTQETIQWDVAGTDGNGINVNSVNIRLSTDGGQTFPVVLASGVPNDGSHVIDVPDSKAPRCFVMVEAVGNFFFALNAQRFSIGEFNEICLDVVSEDVPKVIPDRGVNEITSTLEIADDVTIESVKVKINDLQHTWVSDLDISIESPAGTVVELLSGRCGDLQDIENLIFDDTGGDIVCNPQPPAITGEVQPLQSLSGLIGERALGTWKLRIVDGADDDGGSLNDWGLEICYSEPVLSVNNYVFDQFRIFPNPSDGQFRIQFNSENTGDVDITLYDLLGRKVADRRYRSQGNAFDEQVGFGGVSSGLYILRVKRGNKISSQKIAIE